jgi:hypothetical protein
VIPSDMFSSRPVALTVIVIIAIIVLSIVLAITFPIEETFSQIQMMDSPDALQSGGLLLQGVNATSPTGREEDIYSIPTVGDIFRITGEVLNNDSVRFSSVRVSAVLLDSNGQTIGEGSAHTSPSGIQPGTTASFEINIFNTSVKGGIGAISNFTMRVDGNRQALTFR